MGLWDKKHIGYAVIICALIAIPLLFESHAVSGLGSDDAGPAYMLSHGYHPWVTYIWTPPNSDIESGLFAIQACIGGAIMGYFLGIFHVQGRIRKEELEKHQKVENWTEEDI
jgi:cobalt/nickel transport protein